MLHIALGDNTLDGVVKRSQMTGEDNSAGFLPG